MGALFADAMRRSSAAQLAPWWRQAYKEKRPDPGVAQGAPGVVAPLPLLGAAREDVGAYESHLQRMLQGTAGIAFEPSRVDAVPTTTPSAPGRALPQPAVEHGRVPDLHLHCYDASYYESTRGALLTQVVHHCQHNLAQRGATDVSVFVVDSWTVARTWPSSATSFRFRTRDALGVRLLRQRGSGRASPSA